MSTNKTPNYQLSQWLTTDPIRMSDFNADNQIIDSALKAEADARTEAISGLQTEMLHAATGSYTGTGTYGSGKARTLTFPFQPKLVIIVANTTGTMRAGTVLIYGQSESCGIGGSNSSGSYLHITVKWSGNSVSWYANSEDNQLNTSGMVYYYFAIG